MPAELIEGYGRPPLTDTAKRKILGQNLMRLHDIDEAEFRKTITGDAVSERQARGLEAPWSNLRTAAGVLARDVNMNENEGVLR
jgi:hypothetical protein